MAIVRDASGNSAASLNNVGIDPGKPPVKDYTGSVRGVTNLNATLTAAASLTMRELFGNTASGKYRISGVGVIRFNVGEAPTTVTTLTGTRVAAGAEYLINIKPTEKLSYIAESATGSFSISELGMS